LGFTIGKREKRKGKVKKGKGESGRDKEKWIFFRRGTWRFTFGLEPWILIYSFKMGSNNLISLEVKNFPHPSFLSHVDSNPFKILDLISVFCTSVHWIKKLISLNKNHFKLNMVLLIILLLLLAMASLSSKKNFALEYHLRCDLIHEYVKRNKIK